MKDRMFADIREQSQEENLPATELPQSSEKIQPAPSALPPAVQISNLWE